MEYYFFKSFNIFIVKVWIKIQSVCFHQSRLQLMNVWLLLFKWNSVDKNHFNPQNNTQNMAIHVELLKCPRISDTMRILFLIIKFTCYIKHMWFDKLQAFSSVALAFISYQWKDLILLKATLLVTNQLSGISSLKISVPFTLLAFITFQHIWEAISHTYMYTKAKKGRYLNT